MFTGQLIEDLHETVVRVEKRSRQCTACVNGEQCPNAVVGDSQRCKEHPEEEPAVGRTASEYGNDEIRWPDGLQHY